MQKEVRKDVDIKKTSYLESWGRFLYLSVGKK
jgi:hypothetical protein